MKMLAPGKGWAMTDHGLFWTANGGKDWKNITPQSSLSPDAAIKDIFFLDARHGWVLFAKYDEPEPKFELAYTEDTGAKWSMMHIRLPKTLNAGLAPGGTIDFADDRQGWMVLDAAIAAFHAGALLVTSDGGPPGGIRPVMTPVGTVRFF
jgi:photosystem II stability/assembly factor-like uncharacterized protein